MNFDGDIALITGAGSKRGIGSEVARQLSARGCKVVLLDVNEEGLKSVVQSINKEIKNSSEYVLGDVTKRSEVKAAVEKVIEKHGKIDILINSAGITLPTRVMDVSDEEWGKIFDVNVKGIFHTTQESLKYMLDNKYGRIVNLSSIANKRGGGSFGGSHYAASKGAVSAYTKAVAREMAPYKITCNCVAPGVIDTDLTGDLLTEALEEKRMQGIPMERKGTAKEVATAILYLASNLSSYITGEEIDINGGLHID